MEIGQVPAYKRWSNIYSYAFRMEVVEAYQSGQMSQRQITRKYAMEKYGQESFVKSITKIDQDILSIPTSSLAARQ